MGEYESANCVAVFACLDEAHELQKKANALFLVGIATGQIRMTRHVRERYQRLLDASVKSVKLVRGQMMERARLERKVDAK